MTPRNTILVGDAVSQLRTLAPESVDCVVTSPPYFLLRDYHVGGQLGLEVDVEAWVQNLRAVMAEVARVLVPSGAAWLNLGDSYSRHARYGAPKKSLFMAPERLALALIEDGWILRNRVTFQKSNAMPASVADRLTNTADVVFFLTRSPRYFFDLDRIREPHTSATSSAGHTRTKQPPDWSGPHGGANDGLGRHRPGGIPGNVVGKNPGDVWRLATASYRGAHFATFPEALIRRPLLATCPVKVCLGCNRSWKSGPGKTFVLGKRIPAGTDPYVRRYPGRWQVLRQPGPLEPTCTCGAPTRPGLVLDPFMGSGTVAAVAQQLGLDWLGIELNPDYVDLAWQRLGRSRPPNAERAA
jgi:site-specific DNA-methyltransferase (adenine-specific)